MKVVLLHPLPLDAGAWADVVDRLDHQLLVPPLYGLGDSVEQWARAVLALAGSGPLVVVGNSVGGSCGIEIARLAPRQVSHLVLVGAKAGHRPQPMFRDQVICFIRNHGVRAAWRYFWEPLAGPATNDVVRDRLACLAARQTATDLIRGVSVFHTRPDRASFLRAWPGPVTVVAGQHDINPRGAAVAARAMKKARYVQLDGVGHYAPVEAPAAVAAIVEGAVRNG